MNGARRADVPALARRKGLYAERMDGAACRAWQLQWLERVVPPELRQRALDCRCIPGDGCGSYLWHAFSFGLLECLEGNEARRAFDGLARGGAVLLAAWEDAGYRLADAAALSARDLEALDDVAVVDEDFGWVYAKTHEAELGPYFWKRT